VIFDLTAARLVAACEAAAKSKMAIKNQKLF
jgi:hypothetical protein